MEIKIRDIGIDLEKKRIEGYITLQDGKEVLVYFEGEEIYELVKELKK